MDTFTRCPSRRRIAAQRLAEARLPAREPRGSQLTARQLEEKRHARLEELKQEAYSLLGISEDMTKEDNSSTTSTVSTTSTTRHPCQPKV